MSKRRQPERSVKRAKPEPKSNKKGKKEKPPKPSRTAAPEVNPLKKAKVDNSALDQLKTVCLTFNLR